MRSIPLFVLPFLLACTTPDSGGFGGGDDDDSAAPNEPIIGYVEMHDLPLPATNVQYLAQPDLATETDPDGRFELVVGELAAYEGLRFDHPDAALTDAWVDIAVPGRGGEELFVLVIPPQELAESYVALGLELDGQATTVRVNARDAEGWDLAGVTVELSAAYEGAFVLDGGQPVPGTVTPGDPSGVFFANVTPGSVQVSASHADRTCMVPPLLTVEASITVQLTVRCE